MVHLAVEESGHVWTAVVMLQLGLYYPLDLLQGTVGVVETMTREVVCRLLWRDSVLLKWGQVEATSLVWAGALSQLQ